MLTTAIIVLHVVFSLGLVLFVLLHRGQGGGLSEMFGGGMSGLHGSALVERNLDRMTIVSGLGWTITTILLVMRLS